MIRRILAHAAIIFGVFAPLFVFAQGAGIMVSPLTFELTANPGEVISNVIRVTNPTDASVIFDMDIEDFTAAGEDGDVIVEVSEDETFSMRKWITAEPKQFTLGPDETQIITFTIRVPANAEPGGHYGTILATIKGTLGVTGAAIAPKVGSLVLLSVSGAIREELFIREFVVPSFSAQGPVPMLIRLENTGSVHVKPIGFIAIHDYFGNKVDQIELEPKRILPGNIRRIDEEWKRRYPMGKFTATIVGSFGISNTPFSATTTFWVFPWKIALELFGALVVIGVILIKTRKRFAMAFKILFKGEQNTEISN
ncbi:MAG: hypothetical protein Q8Q39_05155 [bacterium]|nr:hypothetical protein [bacterium]